MHSHVYPRLVAMAVLSFVAMYILMYAMANTFGDVFNNINQVYMAGLMAAPMVIIELVVMWSMYENRTANVGIIAVSAVAALAFFLAIRAQTAVADTQFVRSMIPHHSAAILMCREAAIRDAELKALCGRIIKSQQEEIDQMNALLRRFDR